MIHSSRLARKLTLDLSTEIICETNYISPNLYKENSFLFLFNSLAVIDEILFENIFVTMCNIGARQFNFSTNYFCINISYYFIFRQTKVEQICIWKFISAIIHFC